MLKQLGQGSQSQTGPNPTARIGCDAYDVSRLDKLEVINRPGVAGAVPQTPSSLIT